MRDRLGFIGLEVLTLVVLVMGLVAGSVAVTKRDTFEITKRAVVCRFGKEDCEELAKVNPTPTRKTDNKAKDDVYVPPPPDPKPKPPAQQPDQGVSEDRVSSNPEPVISSNPEVKCWNGNFAPDGDLNNCPVKPTPPH